ncbi:hypothetical protein [Mycobacterium saskatchewanense]|uniref:hypothetical protein n=1 Tax=Mycobacterium saskatchewanense TaxID=220927 RepID=UPI0013028688|nr:hypothetical protein [Mycobacterium saskatchewanense]
MSGRSSSLVGGGGGRAQWSDRRGRERQRTEAKGAQRSPEVAAELSALLSVW